MREYLFRGKRKDNGKWVFGGVLPYDDSVSIVAVESFPGYFDPCSGYGEPPSSELCDYLVDPKTVGQYTMKDDKNGTRIFEGDIISYSVKGWRGTTPVWYSEDRCGYTTDFCTLNGFDKDEIEVVGNVFDNQDLLEEYQKRCAERLWGDNKNKDEKY